MTEWLSVLGDALIAGAAVTGAVVAVLGLKTWKTQMRGQEDHELARRLLVTVFRYRDAIRQVRNPGMFAYEMPAPPPEQAAGMADEQKRHYGTVKAYEARPEPVNTNRQMLYPDLLLADALWGKDVSQAFDGLHKLERELVMNIRNEMRAQDPKAPEKMRDAYRNILSKSREVLYARDAGDDDEFQKEFNEAVEKIESLLKSRLIKSPA